MLKSNRGRLAVAICFALLAAGCGDDDSPTAPTNVEPEPEPITLTGTWSGRVEGNLVIGEAMAMLTQDGANVTGDWSMQMPAALVAVGAPAEVDLEGPVTGTVTDMTAALSFGFLEAFTPYFGSPDCGIDVSVTSFDATTMEATWTTNDSCQPPVDDMGMLTFMRQ